MNMMNYCTSALQVTRLRSSSRRVIPALFAWILDSGSGSSFKSLPLAALSRSVAALSHSMSSCNQVSSSRIDISGKQWFLLFQAGLQYLPHPHPDHHLRRHPHPHPHPLMPTDRYTRRFQLHHQYFPGRGLFQMFEALRCYLGMRGWYVVVGMHSCTFPSDVSYNLQPTTLHLGQSVLSAHMSSGCRTWNTTYTV